MNYAKRSFPMLLAIQMTNLTGYAEAQQQDRTTPTKQQIEFTVPWQVEREPDVPFRKSGADSHNYHFGFVVSKKSDKKKNEQRSSERVPDQVFVKVSYDNRWDNSYIDVASLPVKGLWVRRTKGKRPEIVGHDSSGKPFVCATHSNSDWILDKIGLRNEWALTPACHLKIEYKYSRGELTTTKDGTPILKAGAPQLEHVSVLYIVLSVDPERKVDVDVEDELSKENQRTKFPYQESGIENL